MDQAADWIHHHLEQGDKVLVHCAFGIERSPLTVVWYLMRYWDMNLTAAYDLVLAKRPEAQYRGAWLPTSVKLDGVLPPREVE
jgi:protein-tyrosine phosphatase